MKYSYSKLLLLGCTILIGNIAQAQLVTDDAFLQGHWLEAAIAPNGSWGNSITPPAGYHCHGGGSADYTDPILRTTPSNSMDFNFDYRHDGFAAGSFGTGPTPWYGPYFLPGTPFDGWSMQVNGIMSSAFYTDAGYNNSLGGTLAGTVTGYSNTGGVVTGVWTGTAAVAGALHITQTNTLDTNASYLIVTTKFINTGGTALPGLYYFVSADPDNDETDSAGSFPTNNHIAYQNDYYHRVEVWARPPFSYHQSCFTGLATKDCRAKALIYEFWPPAMVTGNDLDKVYAGTTTDMGTCYYTEGATTFDQDIAYGIVYNLGSLGAGDSTVLSFAWIFTDSTGVDSAFPEPQIVTQGIAHDSLDTVQGCSIIGSTFPATVIGGTAGVWSWSHWTWAPATGLSATTGTNVTVNMSLLGGPTTYTITGTDTSSGSMTSCNTKVFYLYVTPCSSAGNNSPCFGDSLKLTFTGTDTVGATYYWYGPGGYSSVLRNPIIYPATFADSGWFYVIKTIGTVSDTLSTHVIIHPLPPMDVTSNVPMCGPMVAILDLSITPDSIGETYSWSGPNSFTSTLPTPTINPFDSTDQGIYTVHATTRYGCKNIGSVQVYPGIDPSFSYVKHYGCYFDTVFFTDNSTNASTYSWNFGDGSPTVTNRNAFHVYSAHDSFNVTLTLTNAHCDTSITLPVDLRHTVTALFSPVPDTFCLGQPTTCLDSSYSTVNNQLTVPFSTVWNYGDGSTDVAFNPAAHTYASPGAYPITLVVTDSIGCQDSITKYVYALLLNIVTFNDTTLCISQPLYLNNTVSVIPNIGLNYSYQWGPDTNLSNDTVQIPTFSGLGLYTYTLTVNAVPYGCPAQDTIRVYSVLGVPLTNVTATSVIELGNSIQLNADSEVIYWWKPNDGSLNNPNINDPIATPTHTTLYTVYGYDVNGCLDSAYVQVVVDSTMEEEIPSGFTPNNDGLNDVFKPFGEKFQSMVDFRVFNRWGQQVFYTNNINVGWDGTYNGVPQDMGTYFYTITVARPGGTGENIVYKGEVTLIR